MEKIILFDQDLQHYRIPIYKEFQSVFKKEFNLDLIVIYDLKNNKKNIDENFIKGINYSFLNLISEVKTYNCKIIIQFIWLRYLFLIPFMLTLKLKRKKIILWSHGINLQKKNQAIKNQLYYLRQKLADSLIIYTPEQKKYIKANIEKVFVANNTLNFNVFPKIELTKQELKKKYNFQEEVVLLCIGRMNTNNRKVIQLIKLAELVKDNVKIILIGPGVTNKEIDAINKTSKIDYLGSIYDEKIICEYYKLSDVFIMPGAIGLAINQAFYYGLPIILEDVNHGPEGYYLKEGINGFLYRENDIDDLLNKVNYLINDDNNYKIISKSAKETITNEGSMKNMAKGFIEAINYVS
tara:strand:- start:12865 stop:13920 length:1056 start_codon:yes stop_codon:yes gene_type:complete